MLKAQKLRFFYILLCLLVHPIFMKSTFAESALRIEDASSSSQLWKSTISIVTKEALWKERDIYDAAHVLMVPMHYAFYTNDETGVEEFQLLLSNFAINELPGGQLNQAQWMYFVSRYLSLKSELNYSLTPRDIYLYQRVAAWLHSQWLFEPSYQWGSLPFVGAEKRLKYIASLDAPANRSYYRAVVDHELFLFAIAADLSYVLSEKHILMNEVSEDFKHTINRVVQLAAKLIVDEGFFTVEGGWLFQPGVWQDHPDYQYAGYERLAENLTKMPINNIAGDSSHAHRWPLFFQSLQKVSTLTQSDQETIGRAYKGFCQQFTENVVKIDANAVFLTNYMDGNNGLYRYRYATTGKNNILGYGPYALSAILGESWYPFCGGVKTVFEAYRKSYPLKSEVLDLYVGPNTTRDRNPLFRWPDYFVNGFAEIQAKQSAFIAKKFDHEQK